MEERGRALPHLHSLEPQERNVREGVPPLACGSGPTSTAIDVAFRHSGWQPNRTLIRAALGRSDVAQSRLDHWDGCGRDAWVLRDPENAERLRIASTTCKDRFCVPCADTRSHRIGRRIREKIAGGRISFLTLTLADNDQTLSGLIDKLIRSFRSLRQWPLWRSAVTGGVAFIEVKWNEPSRRWHPHLHIIMAADYLAQDAISDRWRAITRTSFIVWIERPDDSERVIRYVTKYGSKPLNQSFVGNPARLDEAIASLKGRHLATAFGDWREWCLLDDDEHEKWLPVDTLSSIIRRAKRGDPEATKIMELLRCSTLSTITPEPAQRAPPEPDSPETISRLNAQAFARDVVMSLVSTLGSRSAVSHSAPLASMMTSPLVSTRSGSSKASLNTPF